MTFHVFQISHQRICVFFLSHVGPCQKKNNIFFCQTYWLQIEFLLVWHTSSISFGNHIFIMNNCPDVVTSKIISFLHITGPLNFPSLSLSTNFQAERSQNFPAHHTWISYAQLLWEQTLDVLRQYRCVICFIHSHLAPGFFLYSKGDLRSCRFLLFFLLCLLWECYVANSHLCLEKIPSKTSAHLFNLQPLHLQTKWPWKAEKSPCLLSFVSGEIREQSLPTWRPDCGLIS